MVEQYLRHFFAEIVVQGAEIVVQGAEIVVQGAEIVVQGAEIVVQGAEIVVQGAEIVVQGAEIVVRGAEIVVHQFHNHFCAGFTISQLSPNLQFITKVIPSGENVSPSRSEYNAQVPIDTDGESCELRSDRFTIIQDDRPFLSYHYQIKTPPAGLRVGFSKN